MHFFCIEACQIVISLFLGLSSLDVHRTCLQEWEIISLIVYDCHLLLLFPRLRKQNLFRWFLFFIEILLPSLRLQYPIHYVCKIWYFEDVIIVFPGNSVHKPLDMTNLYEGTELHYFGKLNFINLVLWARDHV